MSDYELPGEAERRLIRSVFGIAEKLHALVSTEEGVLFACGVEPQTSVQTLRGTFLLDNVTCEGCWTVLRARSKRGQE